MLFIHKEENFAGFKFAKKIESDTPSRSGFIVEWFDSDVRPNHWYSYRVEAYRNDSIAGTPVSLIHTVKTSVLPGALAPRLVLGKVLSQIHSDYRGWSLYSGDTILVNEWDVGAYEASIIKVSDPTEPLRQGKRYFPDVRLATG